MSNEDWLPNYQELIDSQPTCDDSWFPQAIAKYREGDDDSGRAISGSFLRLAFRLAQQEVERQPEFTLLDLVQEANAGIVDALKCFEGSTTADFLEQATRAIHDRFKDLQAVS